MEFIEYFLFGFFCGNAFLYLIISIYDKKDCHHDFESWGDVYDDKQTRICKKCRLIEKRWV